MFEEKNTLNHGGAHNQISHGPMKRRNHETKQYLDLQSDIPEIMTANKKNKQTTQNNKGVNTLCDDHF